MRTVAAQIEDASTWISPHSSPPTRRTTAGTRTVSRPRTRGVYAFDVEDGRTLGNRRLFREIEPGIPDGFCVDPAGRVCTSSDDGVQIFSPDGGPLAKIPTPQACSNCAFGGADGSRLFITSGACLYALDFVP